MARVIKSMHNDGPTIKIIQRVRHRGETGVIIATKMCYYNIHHPNLHLRILNVSAKLEK
jgi:hypothetical protein